MFSIGFFCCRLRCGGLGEVSIYRVRPKNVQYFIITRYTCILSVNMYSTCINVKKKCYNEINSIVDKIMIKKTGFIIRGPKIYEIGLFRLFVI